MTLTLEQLQVLSRGLPVPEREDEIHKVAVLPEPYSTDRELQSVELIAKPRVEPIRGRHLRWCFEGEILL